MNIPYPFIPFQMTLLDMFIEGFPSFMILFERNIEKPKESIGHHAMRFSLPNALAIVLSVAGIRLLAPTLQLSLAETFSEVPILDLIEITDFLATFRNACINT